MDAASGHNANDAITSGSHCDQIIDSRLYKAAAEGNSEPFKEKNITCDQLQLSLPTIKTTILHIYIASAEPTVKSTMFVEQILEIYPSLLSQVNARGDTLLHQAAKLGHSNIVKVLIERAKVLREEEVESGIGAAKKMLRVKNNEGNTALHEAVRNEYLEIVKILAKEDPDYSYSVNDSGESPLFIAAERGHPGLVKIILDTWKSPDDGGPDGKTALHAAAMRPFPDFSELARIILNKKSSSVKSKDNNGWTPLHYAAYYGCFSVVRVLLESDAFMVFVGDKVRRMTPLHMAASQGHKNIILEIMLNHPDCCELVDVRGRNVLHFAMVVLSIRDMDDLLTNSLLKNHIRYLINCKDIDGNTPLHLLAACRPGIPVPDLMKKVEGCHYSLNKENDSVLNLICYGSPKLQQEIQELKVAGNGQYRNGIIRCHTRMHDDYLTTMEKGKEAQLVVSALVATVTFAAAFTMPGGFNQEEGTAILTKKAAFQAFIITDAIALVLSLFAVFLHFIASRDIKESPSLFQWAYISNLLAMGAMMVAFVTGTCAVLTPSFGLAFATSFVGMSFFVLVFGIVIKIAIELYSSS